MRTGRAAPAANMGAEILMGSAGRRRSWRTAVAAAGLSIAAHGAPPDADALAALWRLHAASPTGHTAVALAGREWLRRFPRSAARPVAQGLTAWHAARSGSTNEAAEIWEAMAAADATPIERAGAEMGRRWLSRLDRDRVAAALSSYYARHAVFPSTLQPLRELPPERRPPLTDRFGAHWQYSPTAFRRIAGTQGHRYDLASPTLGERSVLNAMLSKPYGAGATPPRAVRRVGEAVQLEWGGERPVLSVGTRQGGWLVAGAIERWVVLSDGDYWFLVPVAAGGGP